MIQDAIERVVCIITGLGSTRLGQAKSELFQRIMCARGRFIIMSHTVNLRWWLAVVFECMPVGGDDKLKINFTSHSSVLQFSSYLYGRPLTSSP